jgi:large subunit ribosomal protein L25
MSHTQVELSVERREKLGTRESRRLRKSGKLPAVVYGHGEDAVSVTLPGKEAIDAIRHGAHVLDLKMEGSTQQALVKDVQYDHLGIEMLHVDLFRVDLNETITSEVPLRLIGEAPGVVHGGILTQMRDMLEVSCKVSDIPDEVTLSVANLEIGDSVHLSEVKLPDGVEMVQQDGDYTVAMIAAPKGKEADDEIENLTGDEPEIIGDKETATPAGEADIEPDPNA